MTRKPRLQIAIPKGADTIAQRGYDTFAANHTTGKCWRLALLAASSSVGLSCSVEWRRSDWPDWYPRREDTHE